MKINCWEYMRCGREPGGKQVDTYGVCPVTTEVSADGLNGGHNGGRICWLIEKNCCTHVMKVIYNHSISSCLRCEFHAIVRADEGISNVCNTSGIYLTRILPVKAGLQIK